MHQVEDVRTASKGAATTVGTALALCLAACYSPDELRDRADRDAYALIDARRNRLFGDTGPFALPASTAAIGRSEFSGPLTTREAVLAGEITDLGKIDVVDALAIAAENSETVQQQKESLYLSALNLAEEQWRFGYRYDLNADGSVAGDVGGDLVSTSTGFGGSVTKILGSGATILGSIGSDLFRFVSTGDGWDAASNIGLSITQPLLRGSGRLVTLEPLRQTERNLIYDVRSYERFRRTFAVQVSQRVFGVLQTINQQENEEYNFNNLVSLSERNEALADAGQMSEIEADQARQNELRSSNRLVALVGNAQRQMDNFKVFLGLPLDVALEFDDDVLGNLLADESFIEGFEEEYAIAVAAQFAHDQRLDVQTSFDQLQDAIRREAIAKDALRTGLGLSGRLDSTSDDGRPLGHSIDDATFNAAVDVDLPVDLLPARNAWRRAELTVAERKRSYSRFLDEVTASVRDAFRNTRNSYESFVIQRDAVALADRRVEGAKLSLEAGRASTRDLLEAQEAQVQAKDGETSSRIDFTLALLDLWLELEVLRVDETGIHVDEELVKELRSRLELARAALPAPEQVEEQEQEQE